MAPPNPSPRSTRAAVLRVAILVLASVLPYAGTLRAPFTLDDDRCIVDNPAIRGIWDAPGRALSAMAASRCGNAARLFGNLTFALNYAWGGLDVAGYHLFNIAVKNVVALAPARLVELGASGIASAVAGLQVDESDPEGRDRLRPDNSSTVVARFDDRRDEARNAHAIRPALQGDELPIGALNLTLHLRGVFRAEVEDVSHLDAARRQPPFQRHVALEAGSVVHLARRRIFRGPALDDVAKVLIVIRRVIRDGHLYQIAVAEDSDSPVSARMMNSWLRSPPIGPVSAFMGTAFRPMRAKVRK